MTRKEVMQIVDKVSEDLKKRHTSEIEIEMIELMSGYINYELRKGEKQNGRK